jgi:hypothetical protein
VSTTALAALSVAFAVVATDVWVLVDARRWVRVGTPVVVRIGNVAVDTPEAWLLGCVVLWVFFFPTYVVARR